MSMERKSLRAALCAAGLFTAATSASAAIIDLSALNSDGTILHFAAGSYDVRYVGPAEGGAYTAWNPWGFVNGCDSDGMNCAHGWITSSAIDFGHGSGNFDRADGYTWYSRAVPDDNRLYATPEQALLSGRTAPKIVAPLADAPNVSAYVDAPAPWRFTLAQDQDIHFFIYDTPYGDNVGGISLEVTPVPLPASLALSASVPLPASVMLLAPALLALRRRRG